MSCRGSHWCEDAVVAIKSVWRQARVGGLLGGDIAAGARAVLDDERLPRSCSISGDDAREHIARPPA